MVKEVKEVRKEGRKGRKSEAHLGGEEASELYHRRLDDLIV
jgi:hypothetical protein